MRAGLAALAMLAATPAVADSFVLVHGAFVGEGYWAPVAEGLRAAGHDVTAVSLRGQGARAAESSAAIGVADHAADIVAAVEALPPPVILVGHSYGTRPMTLAWDIARERVGHVVYIEGAAPATDSLTAIGGDGQSLALVVTLYPDVADSGLLPPPPTLGEEHGPLAEMSLRALYGAVEIGAPLPPTPGTYVYGRDSELTGAPRLAEHMHQFRGWQVVELPGGHDVVGDAAADLIGVLLSIAAADGCTQGGACP